MEIRRIGVLTSGGDAPGMNCAIRAVVRTGIGLGLEVFGVNRGYSGLLDMDIRKLDVSSVGNILQHGGTILQTSRCPEFHHKDSRLKAYKNLKSKGIDGLIVIGGDGSYQGAIALHNEQGLPVIGIPGTIDNDIKGTEYTIGFNSAVQTAIEAVDKIRDTASSHNRTFIVEVMGRRSPAIAYKVGVCTGAENVVLGAGDNYEHIAVNIKRGIERGKTSSIIIVAEGETPGASYKIQKRLKDKFQIDAHVCVLGHTQRGGAPSSTDRVIASKMGHLAVQTLSNMMNSQSLVTVVREGKVQIAELKECIGRRQESDESYNQLIQDLSI